MKPTSLTAAAALALLAVCSSPTRGQTVTGVVRDAATSAPLAGVLVSLVDPNGDRVRAVLSDETGRFAVQPETFGRYQLRAERIGLRSTTTDAFELFSTNPRFETVLMNPRAIEIAGLVVDSRIRQCRSNRDRAVQIQRWWQEVRTALDVSTVVQDQGLARFRIERFEREWDTELKEVVATDSRMEMNLSDRPFISAEVEFLSDGGFVQGGLTGQLEYYAPDAEVLLSGRFLAEHCFSLSKSDDERIVGLSFEPVDDKDVPDIRGTLWVDTTTAELQSLEYRYTNLYDFPKNDGGGYVSFQYLPTGAWIVGGWYIRMPRIGVREIRGRSRYTVLGYVDVGGRVSPQEPRAVTIDPDAPRGSLTGIVYDSIRGKGLADATVTLLGTDIETTTDGAGRFAFPEVPVGSHEVAFSHDDPRAWGLGSAFVAVDVEEGVTSSAYLALPGFRQAARIVCMGSGNDAETVLVGHVSDKNGQPMGNVGMRLSWMERSDSGIPSPRSGEIRTGSDGRYVVCTIPSGLSVSVDVWLNGAWARAFTVPLLDADIQYRRILLPVEG